MNDERVDCYIIAGYNKPTVVQVIEEDGEVVAFTKSNAGDGTVPLVNAIESDSAVFDNPVYLVDGLSHTELFSDADVVALVGRIIDEGEAAAYGDFERIKRLKDGVKADGVLKDPEYVGQWTDHLIDGTIGTIYDIVVAHCPVALTLFDPDGKAVGTVSSAGIDTTGAYRELFEWMNGGESKQVIVPDGYTVEITGEGEGEMDLMWVQVAADGTTFSQTALRKIAVQPQMRAQASLTEDDMQVKIDDDGDGVFDRTLSGNEGEKRNYTVNETPEKAVDARIWIVVGIGAFLLVGAAVAICIIVLTERRYRRRMQADAAAVG